MEDEIKEILRNCEKAINEASGYNDTTDKILDYITNLQEENERLNNQYDLMENSLDEKQEVIDKAIEYIMTELITEWDIKNGGYVSGSDLPVDAITPLLNILRGEGKDE